MRRIARVHRRGLGDVLQRQVVLQRGGVDVAARSAGATSSSDFFSLAKNDAALVGVGVERLDAEPVAGAEQHPLLGVPDQEREHAAQLADDLLARGSGSRRRSPRRRRRSRRSAPNSRGQPLAQLEVVVDLAVEDQVVAAVEPGQRLVRVVDVDDRQPAEADHRRRRRATRRPRPGRGGACRSASRRQPGRPTPRVAVRRQESDQSAHAVQYPWPGPAAGTAGVTPSPGGARGGGPVGCSRVSSSKSDGVEKAVLRCGVSRGRAVVVVALIARSLRC